MKLRKNLYKINDLEQNSILNVSSYQKKLGRLDRCDRKIYSRKKKKLWKELNVREKALILAERLNNKSALGKFSKQSV